MPKSCIVCSAVASPDVQLQYCAQCQSALYCSRACQRKDWKKQHRQICKLLNVGHGGRQVRTDTHTSRQIDFKEISRGEGRSLDEGGKRFFKLFEESTLEGSQAAAKKMRNIARRLTQHKQVFLLFHSFYLLLCSDRKKLLWPNSPLLVVLEFVDPNVRTRHEDAPLEEGVTSVTPLQHLADLVEHSDYSNHENQLILAKQLVEHGADVNAVSIPQRQTPLHNACYSSNVTNLDLVEYLLEAGADPNALDNLGHTPLMHTTPYAPGAARFLLNWPTTDANITTRSGASFLAMLRSTINMFSNAIAFLPDDPKKVQHQFLLQQWREIEDMLVGRGAHDTGITAIE